MPVFRPSLKSVELCHRIFVQAFILPATVLFLILLQSLPVAAQDRDQEHFFEAHVRPVLVEKCVGCHGEQEQSGGLRLDSRDAMLKGGESGAALIPGDVTGSQMIQAIRYDGELQMPPDNELPDAEKHALIQ